MAPAELSAFMTGVQNVSNKIKSLKTRWNPSYLLGTAWQRDFQEAILTNLSAQGVKGGPAEGKSIAFKSAKYMFSPEQSFVLRAYLTGTDPDKGKLTRLRAALPGSTVEGMEDLTVLFDQFLRDGGAVGYAMISEAADRVQSFDSALGVIAQLQKGKPVKAALEFAGLGLDFLDTISQVIDMQARFATYRASIEEGISRENAALLALDSSLNLTRRGEWAPWMDAWMFFASAGIEGGRKFVKQGLSSRNARVLMAASIKIGAVIHLWNLFRGGDDDEDGRDNIYDVNDGTRQQRFVMYYGSGTNDYVKIPVAFSFGFSKYVGEQMAALAMQDISPMEAAVNSVSAFRQMAIPFKTASTGDLGGDLLTMFSPIAPFVQAESNVNFFGSNIYRENKFDTGPRSEQGREDTAGIWKSIARGVNSITGGTTYQPGDFSRQPEYYEYLASDYGGGLFKFINSALQGEAPTLLNIMGSGGEYAPMNNFYRSTEGLDSMLTLYKNEDMGPERWQAEWSSEQRRYPLRANEEIVLAYDVAKDELKANRESLRNGEYENLDEYYADNNEVYKAFNRLFNEVKRKQE